MVTVNWSNLIARKSKCVYVLIFFLFAILGTSVHLFLIGAIFTDYHQLNSTELRIAYENYKNNDLPLAMGKFQEIYFGNIFTSILFILLPVILYWILFYFINYEFSPRIMKLLIFGSIFFFGYNSFVKSYPFFRIYPFDIFLSSLVFHGIIEIPTFLICAVWSLSNLDKMADDLALIPPLSLRQKINNSFRYCIYPIIIGLILFAIAAFIETQITPYMILNSFMAHIT